MRENSAANSTIKAVVLTYDECDDAYAQLPTRVRRYLLEEAVVAWNPIAILRSVKLRGEAEVLRLLVEDQKSQTVRLYGPQHPQS